MSSRWISGRFPATGTSRIADLIRERRGARGLTDLDGALLHVPAVAEGWNTLLGAIRTKGNLPGDVRELMILRVAAHNRAAYEWIHHEHVGRDQGLTTPQLVAIRNTSTAYSDFLTPLQSAALAFADASTREVQVSSPIMQELKTRLGEWVTDENQVQDLLVEAAAVVSVYNMVSRFLVSLDVAGKSNTIVPWPVDRQEHTVPLPNAPGQHLHVVTLTLDRTRPWVILANSLLTNYTMWDPVLPYLHSALFNVIVYDQRGHGQSTVPHPPVTTMKSNAEDIAAILSFLNLSQVESVMGVSQGGATALNFARLYPDKTRSVIVCDTQAIGPQANIQAWEDRLALANATSDGMNRLAEVTVPRWFPKGSLLHSNRTESSWIEEMISKTDKVGFESGVRSLQGYDLVQPGNSEGHGPPLWSCPVRTLLVAGELDGGGKIAQGLESLTRQWTSHGGNVRFAEVKGCGHLPMVDGPERFWGVIEPFLLGRDV